MRPKQISPHASAIREPARRSRTVAKQMDMPEARALAGVLRRLREGHHWSQSKLAKLSGVSRQMIGNIEKDVCEPTVSKVTRLARAFDLSYGELGMKVTKWLERQPAQCRACRYTCIARGRLVWLNRHRDCIRPTV